MSSEADDNAPRVFVTRPIPEAGLERLRAAGSAVEIAVDEPDDSPDRKTILDGCRRSDVLLSLLTEPIDAAMLEQLPRLTGVSNYAVGVDNIDVDAATRSGIPVGNTPDVLTESTADLTWALLLAVTRRLVEGDALVRAGEYRRWGPELLLGRDVSPGGDGRRRRLGIIGFGRIGRAVARRARGFDLEVVAYGPRSRDAIEASDVADWASLEELLTTADFVSIHAPLTSETHHMIGSDELTRMRTDAYLINTARGPIVDEAALVRALQTGAIAGAGLDVTENEPEMAPGLAELNNVVLLPHLGSATRDTRDRMALLAADNALAMLSGDPAPHCVNPEVYDSAAWRQRIERALSRDRERPS